MIGGQYAYLALQKGAAGMRLCYVLSEGKAHEESVAAQAAVDTSRVTLKMTLTPVDSHSAKAQFAYSTDGKTFAKIGEPYSPARHTWVGARLGLFAMGLGGEALFGPFSVTPEEENA